jgi:hypothetical protein
MIAFGKADVLHFGSALYGLRSAFHGKVFNNNHRISISEFIAICIQDLNCVICFAHDLFRVPFMEALGAYHEVLLGVGEVGVAVGAVYAVAHRFEFEAPKINIKRLPAVMRGSAGFWYSKVRDLVTRERLKEGGNNFVQVLGIIKGDYRCTGYPARHKSVTKRNFSRYVWNYADDSIHIRVNN